MRINKINHDDILSYEEFMTKCGNELDKDDISQETIDNLVNMIKEYDDWRKYKYIELIKKIYISIIEVEYLGMTQTIGLEESIWKFVRYAYCLKSDIDFIYDEGYWNITELCNKAYDNLLHNGVDGKYMKEEMPEEFKPEHLLDIEYHFNNFKKYIKNNTVLKELDSDIWRRMV